MIAALAIGIAILVIAVTLWLDHRQRRREARRHGDAVFLRHALDVAKRGRRIRPKIDPRIQRRRYGQS